MNKRKAFNNKKGFTLVEMIVVIVILGILLAIMVPQLIKYIDKAKAVQCRADVSYIMKEYQIEALEKDPGNAKDARALLVAIITEHNGAPGRKVIYLTAEFIPACVPPMAFIPALLIIHIKPLRLPAVNTMKTRLKLKSLQMYLVI